MYGTCTVQIKCSYSSICSACTHNTVLTISFLPLDDPRFCCCCPASIVVVVVVVAVVFVVDDDKSNKISMW